MRKNYPKEIDQLTTRFQADRLTYQNERDRLFSYRFYLGGIIVCIAGLISFPVSQLEEDIPSARIEAFAGSNDTEGGTGYPEEEYVPVQYEP